MSAASPVTERRSEVPRIPAWASVLDLATVVLLLVALAVVLFGGWRGRIAGVRIVVLVWWRPAVAALAIFALRHILVWRNPLHQRVGRVARRLLSPSGLHLAGRLVVVGVFLSFVASSYEPETGFTSLISFGGTFAGDALPAVRAAPHAVLGPNDAGYDGQFYAQLAADPLLRDRAIDHALDNPPYRARRILFAWTAYVLGLGRTAWVLNAYALQNVLAWLVLAWLLARWFPIREPRTFVPWVGCLLGSGLVGSVRFALLDGPGMLVLTLAVIAVECGRWWLGVGLVGLGGLGRETNLLGGSLLVDRLPLTFRQWTTLAPRFVAIVLPLVLWHVYLGSLGPVYSAADEGARNFSVPLAGFIGAWRLALGEVWTAGWWATPGRFSVLALIGITTQAGFLMVRREWANPWWRLGAAYCVLLAALGPAVWEGWPGAYPRVLLPLTFAFNVIVLRSRWFWPLALLGNASVLHGIEVIKVPFLWNHV